MTPSSLQLPGKNVYSLSGWWVSFALKNRLQRRYQKPCDCPCFAWKMPTSLPKLTIYPLSCLEKGWCKLETECCTLPLQPTELKRPSAGCFCLRFFPVIKGLSSHCQPSACSAGVVWMLGFSLYYNKKCPWSNLLWFNVIRRKWNWINLNSSHIHCLLENSLRVGV